MAGRENAKKLFRVVVGRKGRVIVRPDGFGLVQMGFLKVRFERSRSAVTEILRKEGTNVIQRLI